MYVFKLFIPEKELYLHIGNKNPIKIIYLRDQYSRPVELDKEYFYLQYDTYCRLFKQQYFL